MEITVTENNGKHTAQVSEGGRLTFRTPEYCTAEMALADAKCWMAFHGEAESMNEFVKPGDKFEGHRQVTGELFSVSAGEMLRLIAEAKSFGLEIIERMGTERAYIEIGRNGSSYGQYFRVA
jgi:hypothetical protein